MRILIVDDDAINSRILYEIVTSYGTCDIAEDGKKAILYVKEAWRESKPYDLVLLDIMMPEIDGQEVLKEIRDFEKRKKVPFKKETKVIMVTALSHPKDVFKAFFKGGTTDYIVKPVDKNKLLKMIDHMFK